MQKTKNESKVTRFVTNTGDDEEGANDGDEAVYIFACMYAALCGAYY